LLAKKQKPGLGLLDKLHAFRAELDEFVNAKAAEMKASRDGASLYIGDLKHMLCKGDPCLCRAVARILGDPDA
jgi:hypothetical protein